MSSGDEPLPPRRLSVHIDDTHDARSAESITTPVALRFGSPRNGGGVSTSSVHRARARARAGPAGGALTPPFSDVTPKHHASARVGTVFGGGGDLTAFQREWMLAQESESDSGARVTRVDESADAAGVAQSPASRRRELKAQLAAEATATHAHATGNASDAATDLLSDEELESRIGVRPAVVPMYTQHRYQTVDEDLADWESPAPVPARAAPMLPPPLRSQIQTPASPSSCRQPDRSRPAAAAAAARPTSRDDDLLGFDIERSSIAGGSNARNDANSSTGARSRPASRPASPRGMPAKLRQAQVEELVRRTLHGLSMPGAEAPDQDEKEQPISGTAFSGSLTAPATSRTLLHAVSAPSLGSSSAASVPVLHLGSTLAPGVEAYLDAAFSHPSGVLSARARYAQLGRACAQVLPPARTARVRARPPPSSSPSDAATLPGIGPRETTSNGGTRSRGPSGATSPRSPPPPSSRRSSLLVSPSSSRPASPRSAGGTRAGGPPRSPGLAIRLLSNPRSPSTSKRRASIAAARPQTAVPARDGADHMRALLRRATLHSERVRLGEGAFEEVGSASSSANSTATAPPLINAALVADRGLALLSVAENERIATRRARVAAAAAAATGKLHARPDIDADIDLSNDPFTADSFPGESDPDAAASVAGAAAHTSGSGARVRPSDWRRVPARVNGNYLDPHLVSVSSAVHEMSRLRRAGREPGHLGAFHVGNHADTTAISSIGPHSAHHQLRLVASSDSDAPARVGEEGSELDVAPPLPSNSRALHLRSASSRPGWTPPAQHCQALAEEIYHATKALGGIVSLGEGREALDRHLTQIRPSHLADDAASRRKNAVAAAVVEQMQNFATAQRERALAARLAAGATIIKTREEARERAVLDARAAEAAWTAALKADLAEAAKKLEEKEKPPSPIQTRLQPTLLTLAPLTIGIEAVPEEEGDTLPSEPMSPTSPPISPMSPVSPQLSPTLSPVLSSVLSSVPPSVPSRPSGWARARLQLETAALSSPPAPAPAAATPAARVKPAASVRTSHARNPSSAAASSSASRARNSAGGVGSGPVGYFSAHRMPHLVRGSPFGPCGEDLTGSGLIPPASYAAGRMLDASVAASDDRATAAEKQRREQAEYTACLARLYQPITPQQKRLRRLDQRKSNRDDLRRVVEETLGQRGKNRTLFG